MLEEIGLIVSLYVIARLVPTRWKAVSGLLSVVTVLLALTVVVDLGLRVATGNSLVAIVAAARTVESTDIPLPTPTETSASTADTTSSYNIDRKQDGPFSFSISGVKFNEGSSLVRESVIFNDPNCPVQITSHGTKFKHYE